ncbi:MAG TPA: glycosyltransferase [Pyrinomonadaceae bacterium]|jgi:glycosyltransferase involved in cell wall biosynthesis
MRITIVISGLGGGGAERVVVNLAHTWASRGYKPTILTISQNSRPSAYAIDEDVELRDVGWPRRARENELNPQSAATISRGLRANNCNELMHDIVMLAMLRFAILTTKPDGVISFVTQTNVRVLAALHESNVPVIACEVTDTRRVWLRGWQRPRDNSYRRAAAVVACDPVIAEWLAARGARATAIHNPLQAPDVPIPANQNPRRRVVTLSRLSMEKRAEWLVRAFASVAERYPDWDLEIYGDGPQRNFLEHLAEDIAPPGRIRICGFVNDAYGVLAGADIFVSASWVEGYGNAIWEALACGVPVIAMDAGPSIGRLVRHELDGLVVKDNSVGGLAAALERLMKNEVERKGFALRAPDVVNRFSMQAALQQWDELLSLFHTR